MAKKAAAKKPRIKVVDDEELSKEAQADAKKDLAETAAEIRELKGEEGENKSTSFPFGANANMAKTATNKKKTATKKQASGKSGSDLVREYYAKHPDAKNSEIAEATKVHPSQVSSVLKSLRGPKKAKAKKGGRPKATSTMGNGHLPNASEFIKNALAIGLDKAIDTLTKVKGLIE